MLTLGSLPSVQIAFEGRGGFGSAVGGGIQPPYNTQPHSYPGQKCGTSLADSGRSLLACVEVFDGLLSVHELL